MAEALIVSPWRGERFVGLVAEDLAEVGDGFARLWTAPDRHAEYQRSALT